MTAREALMAAKAQKSAPRDETLRDGKAEVE